MIRLEYASSRTLEVDVPARPENPRNGTVVWLL
jgi:hypothetical protein